MSVAVFPEPLDLASFAEDLRSGLLTAGQHEAHEEGEAEQKCHAHAAVLGALDTPHEAPGYAEEQHEGDERAAGEEGEVQLHADQGAGHCGRHRQREQGISVAQDTLLRLADLRGGGLRVGADVFHGLASPPVS